jgi:hypothetical protein
MIEETHRLGILNWGHWLMLLPALLLGWGRALSAASPDDGFYKGKTIRLIVAFSAGGGCDTYARTIARHLGKYIPGNPTVVVDNMTGAGGIIHANYMFKQAKPDGLTIGNNSGGSFLQQVMGAKGIEFDGNKFEYIGAPAVDHLTCAISKASGITSLDTCFASKEAVRFGGVGPGGFASDPPRVLQAALGLPVRVIDGYKGTSDIRLATTARGCRGAFGIPQATRASDWVGEVNIIIRRCQNILSWPTFVGRYYAKQTKQRLITRRPRSRLFTRPCFTAEHTEDTRASFAQGVCRRAQGPGFGGRSEKSQFRRRLCFRGRHRKHRSWSLQDRTGVRRKDEAGVGAVFEIVGLLQDNKSVNECRSAFLAC